MILPHTRRSSTVPIIAYRFQPPGRSESVPERGQNVLVCQVSALLAQNASHSLHMLEAGTMPGNVPQYRLAVVRDDSSLRVESMLHLSLAALYEASQTDGGRLPVGLI